MSKHHLGPWHTDQATPDPLEPDPEAGPGTQLCLGNFYLYAYLYVTVLHVSDLRILF